MAQSLRIRSCPQGVRIGSQGGDMKSIALITFLLLSLEIMASEDFQKGPKVKFYNAQKIIKITLTKTKRSQAATFIKPEFKLNQFMETNYSKVDSVKFN